MEGGGGLEGPGSICREPTCPFPRAAFIPHQAPALRGKKEAGGGLQKAAESFTQGRIGDDFFNAALCGSPAAGTPLMSLVCSCWQETFRVSLLSLSRRPTRGGDLRPPREPGSSFPEVGFPRVRHRRIARPPACQSLAGAAGKSRHSWGGVAVRSGTSIHGQRRLHGQHSQRFKRVTFSKIP